MVDRSSKNSACLLSTINFATSTSVKRPTARGDRFLTTDASRAAVKFFISLSFCFRSFFKTRQPPVTIGSSLPMRHERRRKFSMHQSCNRRITGVCGDDNAALEIARQKSLVPNNALRFFATRGRDDRKAPGSFTTDPFDFSSVVFIRSL